MKKVVILFIAGLLSLSVQAQRYKQKGDLGEKYHTQKVAYITNALDLSAEESAAFWPVYNEHEKKVNELKNEMKDYRLGLLENEDDLTEEEAKEAVIFLQNHVDNMHQLEKEYQNKFLEIIPAKKVLLLMKAEKDFRRELLRKLGEKRDSRGKH